MIALMVFYGSIYILCSEYIVLQPLRGDVLLFPKSQIIRRQASDDAEQQNTQFHANQGPTEANNALYSNGDFGLNGMRRRHLYGASCTMKYNFQSFNMNC